MSPFFSLALLDHLLSLIARLWCAALTSSQLCREYSIGGFPTVILFQNNNFEIYQGERSTAAMAQFALTSSPASAFVPVVVDPNEVHAPPPALPQDGRVRARSLVASL